MIFNLFNRASFVFRLQPFDAVTLHYDKNGKLCKSTTTLIGAEKVCSEDEIEYTVDQSVFVDHCIMNTDDAALSSLLEKREDADIFVNKGYNPEVVHTN